MSAITKEQAKDLRNAFECWQQDYDPAEDKEQYDMFGLGMVAMDALLASLESEPAGVVRHIELRGPEHPAGIHVSLYSRLDDGIELYTAPPAQVVPDMAAVGEMPFLGTQEKAFVSGWNACRAAMLQSFGNSEQLNSPVIQDGWVACSERMPEREVDVQVYCADRKEQMVGYMERNERNGYFRFASLRNGGGVYCQPTHWMPLPAAPQQKVK